MEKTKKDMDRRNFLKLLGAGAAVTSSAFSGSIRNGKRLPAACREKSYG